MPYEELIPYASRLLSMEEAFAEWFRKLSEHEKKLLLLLVRYPVLSVDYAFKEAGILNGSLSDDKYQCYQKTQILSDISKKKKYILENAAIYTEGFIRSPALFRRYMAHHLKALEKYGFTDESKSFLPEDIKASSVKISKVLEKLKAPEKEKLKKARTIKEALSVTASFPDSFDAEFLVPHLHINPRYWYSPQTHEAKIRQVQSTASFLESAFFSDWVSFSAIENSFEETLIKSVPEFYIPLEGNGLFVRLDSPDVKAKAKKALLRTSSFFGKRFSLSSAFLYDFVSVPAFNNLLLILSSLNFFECVLEDSPDAEVHSALLYPLGKIKAVKRLQHV